MVYSKITALNKKGYDMSSITPIKRLWDECWNNRDFDVIDEIFSQDFILHAFGNTMNGPEVVKEILRATVDGFSDIHQYLDECFVSGKDIMTTCWHGVGTHDGIYNDIPATGKKFIYHGITVFRVRGELIVEAWFCSDEAQQFANLTA